MQHQYMQRIGLMLICLLAFVSVTAFAGTYTLTDGTKIEGEPINIADIGVLFRASDGTDLDRVPWDKLTQESIRELLATVKTSREKAMIEPLIEELPQERTQGKDLVVKPIEPPERPKTHLGIMAVFGSPIGWVILLILYGANLFAAYEVAIYRRQPVPTVCGLAAIPFFGVFSPIAFVAMPTRTLTLDGHPLHEEEPQSRFRATPPPAETAAPPAPVDAGTAPASNPSPVPVATAAQAQPAAFSAPGLPEPIVFRRGDFSFNRRFFETKLAGFFRVVPSETEKDLVVAITSGRGNFTGRRITRITPNELYLQVFHDNATADEMIPFVEILEVQIKHKDIA
jgi:hypothetical protein